MLFSKINRVAGWKRLWVVCTVCWCMCLSFLLIFTPSFGETYDLVNVTRPPDRLPLDYIDSVVSGLRDDLLGRVHCVKNKDFESKTPSTRLLDKWIAQWDAELTKAIAQDPFYSEPDTPDRISEIANIVGFSKERVSKNLTKGDRLARILRLKDMMAINPMLRMQIVNPDPPVRTYVAWRILLCALAPPFLTPFLLCFLLQVARWVIDGFKEGDEH